MQFLIPGSHLTLRLNSTFHPQMVPSAELNKHEFNTNMTASQFNDACKTSFKNKVSVESFVQNGPETTLIFSSAPFNLSSPWWNFIRSEVDVMRFSQLNPLENQMENRLD